MINYIQCLAKKKLRKIHDFKKEIIFFESGRGALDAILKTIHKIKRKNIGVIPYTCAVVPAVCIENDFNIVWLDIELNTYSIDYNFLKKEIKKLDVIILQSTYGIVPFYYNEIITLCKKKGIIVIEDLAHSLGAKYKNNYLGNLSDYSFGSFQRSKQISIWSGGFTIGINEKKLFKSEYGGIDNEIILSFIETFKNRLSILRHLTRFINHFIKKKGMSEMEKKGKIENYRKKRLNIMKSLLLCIALTISEKKITRIQFKTKQLIEKNKSIFGLFFEYEKNNKITNSYLRIPLKKNQINKKLSRYLIYPFWFCLYEDFFKKYNFEKLINFQKAIDESKTSVNISLY